MTRHRIPLAPLRHTRHTEYTIGWICALPKEMTAATAMLDELRENLTQPTSDHNNYCLGRIGQHNVVIACLPSGEMGTTSATSVAIQMRTTFTSIRVGLMVGIGGGVPSAEHDIRLGDLVVGIPNKGSGGVVQYDLGKSTQDNNWVAIGSLNSPHPLLKTTIAKLEALHQIHGNKIQKNLAEMARKHPRLVPQFTRPPQVPDILYEPEPEDSENFSDWVEMKRRPRSLDQPNRIHFGLIASGNQVIKSGRKRDKISRSLGGVLCFEMEAAGLMNNFPCVVIRGVCDYADTHKKKDWQEYAAAVAAAYAKEVIMNLPMALMQEDAGTPSPKTATSSASGPFNGALWLVPFSRNEQFVGRKLELCEISRRLAAEQYCRRVAIFGLGGIGKTQIALEFAYRRREEMPSCSVFWIPATEPAVFEETYRKVGQLLRIPGIDRENADVKQVVKDFLQDEITTPWLLIIDNADDTDVLYHRAYGPGGELALIDYLPFSRNGAIVFTTRSRRAAVKQAGNDVISVGLMSQQDARHVLESLLIRQSPLGMAETRKLLGLLGGLPLAIIQAAAYMNENDVTIEDYTEFYSAGEKELVEILSEDFEDQGRYRNTKNSIAATWLISFNQIRRQTPLAIEYLSIFGCLQYQNIPQSLLPPPPSGSKKQCSEAIGALTSYSFIYRQDSRDLFDMHRLVHLATRNWLKKEGKLSEWTNIALQRLTDVIPPGGHHERSTWTPYLPHAIHLLDSEEVEHNHKFIELCDRAGQCLYSNGQYNEAERLHRRTLALRVKLLGRDDPSTLSSAANLAEALSHQGKFMEAEGLHRKTLEFRKAVLGESHPDVIISMRYLGQMFAAQGFHGEAEKLHRDAAELRKTFGDSDPLALTSMSYLAETLKHQGKFEAAEQMHKRILETRSTVLGLEDPATLASMSCLGVAQDSLGKHSEAVDTHKRVLDLRTVVLGDRHPHTLITKMWLAEALRHQGMYNEAADIGQATFTMQHQLLGPKHPNTLATMNGLAETFSCQGKLAEARSMIEEVLGVRQESLGVDHPHTLAAMNSLAGVLHRQGQQQAAKELYENTRDRRLKHLGPDHPDTLSTIESLSELQRPATL